MGSPIGAFLRERCVVAPGAEAACDDLYNQWLDWCRDQNREHVGNVQEFGRNLRAAVAGIKVTNNRLPNNGPRVRTYQGVRAKARQEIDH